MLQCVYRLSQTSASHVWFACDHAFAGSSTDLGALLSGISDAWWTRPNCYRPLFGVIPDKWRDELSLVLQCDP
jgi:hypothetical protein